MPKLIIESASFVVKSKKAMTKVFKFLLEADEQYVTHYVHLRNNIHDENKQDESLRLFYSPFSRKVKSVKGEHVCSLIEEIDTAEQLTDFVASFKMHGDNPKRKWRIEKINGRDWKEICRITPI